MPLVYTRTPGTPSPWGGIIIQALVVILVNWVIFTYLIPLLVAPLSTIAVAVVVILDILWLLRVADVV